MRLLPLLISVLLAPQAFAVERPALDEAVHKALAHSPDVTIARARVAQAEAQVRAARRGWFHPEVRVFAGESATTGATRAGIQVSQDLLRLVSLNHDEVQQAESECAIASQTLLLTQARVIHQVSEALATLQQATSLVRVSTETVMEEEQRLVLAKARFEDTSGTFEQLLAARHAQTRAQQELECAQESCRLARLTVEQLLGNPIPEDGRRP